ncbi:MAG: LuxR C-terminal-related transcriptional regulator [Rhizobiaceae bacterium]|nr:LuxR C-terminal-related transcriptional regulator [Rhizobiaceae bacterium]
MSATLAISAAAIDRRSDTDLLKLPEIVAAIGGENFAEQLLSCFNNLIGADHCSVFRLKDFELLEVASASLRGAGQILRSDLTSYEVKRQLSMSGPAIRVDVSSVHTVDPGRVDEKAAPRRQRVMVCARRPEASYCLRVIRSAHRPALEEEEIESLRKVAGVLVSVVSKHLDLTMQRPNLTPALCSLDEIERCVQSTTDLSRREGEVCARILYGLSSCGIALDLGIGKESVMTYRKRAYQRLGIGSQRELLMWYLTRWSAWTQADTPSAAIN